VLNAIRVEMVELEHPNPRNAVATTALPTQTVPQNFSKFDTNSNQNPVSGNSVCSGATVMPNYNGHPCNTVTDCLPAAGGTPACTNLVTCTATNEQGGCARWVGKPATFLQAQERPDFGTYRAARLQCTPFYYDFVEETKDGVCAGPLAPQSNNGAACVDNSGCTPPATCVANKLTVVGAEILPSSTYSVRTYGSSCAGIEGSCPEDQLGAPVTIKTRRFGDVTSPFNPPDVNSPGNGDLSAINSALGKTGPLRNWGGKTTPNAPELNLDLGDELGRMLFALNGYAYPPVESGPCPCPPVHPVTSVPLLCSALSCACEVGPPCGTCGGGQCVKTCTGGVNDGLACRNNDHGHCPGGTCGSGFCRDKCARCISDCVADLCVGGRRNGQACTIPADCLP
jgi:hypothetical protein